MRKITFILINLALICLYTQCTKNSAGNKDVIQLKVHGTGEAKDMVVDAQGNTYVVGNFNGTAAFGDTEKNTNHTLETFLVKYDSSGVMKWHQTAGTSEIVPKPEGAEFQMTVGSGIVLDSHGNIYIAGTFEKQARFGNIVKTSDTDGMKTYIAKYSNTGEALWVEEIKSTNSNFFYGLAIDKNDNLYITGSFMETLLMGGTPIPARAEFDNYLARYNTDGKLQWVKPLSDKDGNKLSSNHLATGTDGNIYVTGSLRPDVPLSVPTEDRPFTAAYNANGDLQWIQHTEEVIAGNGSRVATDKNSNVYVLGFYKGTIKFGNVTLGSYTADNGMHFFLTKYDSKGNPQWAKPFYGKGLFMPQGLTVDKNDNVYVSGNFQEKMGLAGTEKTSTGKIDIFISKFNTNGALQWVKTTSGNNNSVSRSIVTGHNNTIFTTGYFSGKTTFDSQNEFPAEDGTTSLFVWRLHE